MQNKFPEHDYTNQLHESLRELNSFEELVSLAPHDDKLADPLEKLTSTLNGLQKKSKESFEKYAELKAYNDDMVTRQHHRSKPQINEVNLAFQNHLQQVNEDSLKALESVHDEISQYREDRMKIQQVSPTEDSKD